MGESSKALLNLTHWLKEDTKLFESVYPEMESSRSDLADRIESVVGHSPTFDAVINLASPASPPAYLARPVETLEVGSTGTRHLLEIAVRDGARFLLASTSEVYGDPLTHPQPESYWGNVNPEIGRAHV